jgi:hypothetical protein
MRHHRFVKTVLAAAMVALAGSAAAQKPAAAAQKPAAAPQPAAAAPQSTDDWYGRMAKPKNFDPPKAFGNTFKIELPKDWQLVRGHTGTIFLVAEKTNRFEAGAAIVLEYSRLQAPVEPSGLETFAGIEFDDVRNRESAGSAFTMEHKMVDGRALILIQYDRTGFSGAPDHVVQYMFPVGQTLYSLICIAPKADIPKYKPIFAHAAASFTPTPAK